MTVINAVALAGGYTARADQSSMTIGRGACRFDTQADSFVNRGDIVIIDERFFCRSGLPTPGGFCHGQELRHGG